MQLIQSAAEARTTKEICDAINAERGAQGVTVLLQHGDFLKKVRDEFEEEIGQGNIPASYYLNSQNKQQPCYLLSQEQTLQILMLESRKIRRRVVDRLKFLERNQKQAVAIPNFSDPAAAARAWAEQYEARLIAESTKAEIGNRREATAMNTASQAVKKAAALEQQLDRAKEYCTVKRMSMIHHGQPFDWRSLKSAGSEMGIPAVDVFDQNYGTVKAYHADVWREVYGLVIDQ